LLPSAQNAAVDTVAASDLSGTRSILRGLIENLALVRLTEPAPMSLGRATIGLADQEEG
jgi:hypothetical protein